MKKVINMTFKLNVLEIIRFESWIMQQVEVINFKILPDTDALYESDNTFKKLVKQVKKAQRVRDDYINDKN